MSALRMMVIRRATDEGLSGTARNREICGMLQPSTK